LLSALPELSGERLYAATLYSLRQNIRHLLVRHRNLHRQSHCLRAGLWSSASADERNEVLTRRSSID
jgi:hypothetical protein